ncbi:MAG: HAD-IIIC family phosphatase, partial [Rickettsia endosymbiont of Ixodes persulcatus]|nr:HAD-IIIC family phosphatase [Rickettsia endosymbiont of Ixodes persulcatus]
MTIITATFTADPITQPLKFFLDLIDLESEINLTPYAQVFQQLLDPHSLFYKNEQGVNILLIRFEDWLPSKSANQLSKKNNLLTDYLDDKVDKFLLALKSAENEIKVPLIIALCRPSPVAYKYFWLKEHFIKLEEKIQEVTTQCIGIYLISTEAIDTYYPVHDYYNNYSNEIGHIPYTESYFLALAATLARKIHAIFYPTHKVVVLDCDNTLWEGICGEVEDINDLKITETQQALQRFIIEQQNIGMLICLCSKNNETDVWSVFDRHPAMLLKRHHIAFYQINWQEKAINISEIAKQLNLSLNSFIFIDDKLRECLAMQKAHPEILTIQYKENIIHILKHIWCLDRLTITQEDRQRTSAYQKKIEKSPSTSSYFSLDQFIKDLQLHVALLPLSADNLKRAAELTRKVNQFNCTTQRFTDKQLQQCITRSRTCLVVHIKDKDEDETYDLTGILIYEFKENLLEVSDFLLSCRVLGCGVEHRILNELGRLAKANDVSLIKFLFIPNDRNEPAETFLTSVCESAVKVNNSLVFNISAENACSVNYEMTQQFVSAKKTKQLKEVIHTETEKTVTQQKKYIDYLTIAKKFSTVEQILHHLQCVNSRSLFTDSVFIAAKTPLEKQLLWLWQESLHMSNLSCADNFIQLGGDSIKATLVLAKIYSIYNIELQISDVLNSTVSELATFIEEKKTKPTLPQQIKIQREESRLFPLSFAQQRLWFLDQLEPNTPLYNMFVAFELKGNISEELLKQTFLVLIERHESLRTCFIKQDGKAYQAVLPYSPKLLRFSWDITLDLAEQGLRELAHKEAQQAFELDNAPLLRIRVVENKGKYILMLCMHHIIHDGWSFHIFCQELMEIYSALVEKRLINLTQKNWDYIDFSSWQYELLSITRQEYLLNYWTKQLADFIPTKLPSDYTQLNNRRYMGDRIAFTISKKTLASIKKLSQASQTTLFTTLFSVFSILISYYTAQKDLVIGTPISGRHYPNLESMIGFFVNILILRADLDGNPSFQAF